MGMNVMHTARAEPAAFGGRLTFLFFAGCNPAKSEREDVSGNITDDAAGNRIM